MTGLFYLSLLNPAIAFGFAGLAALLLHRWPAQIHLFPLSLAFCYLGLGFVTNEWPTLSHPGEINYAANALFFAAVLLACSSTLVRAQVKVPVLVFGAVSTFAVLGFIWFAFVVPSTALRIYILHACFAVLAVVTAGKLLKNGIKTLADRLFVAAVALGGALAIARPVLILIGAMDINPSGDLAKSGYWDSVIGLTPFLSITVVSVFVFALVLDVVEGLRREADYDYLSGLLNRRGFEVGVKDRLAKLSNGRPLPALTIADIDDFKQINDRFGHAAGDSVIAAVGKVLKEHGGANLAGRIGGEEFALFYDGATRPMLSAAAERIRRALAEIEIDGLPSEQRFTISIGIHVREDEETLADMMRRADRALYDAKAAGKNRAVQTPARLRSA